MRTLRARVVLSLCASACVVSTSCTRSDADRAPTARKLAEPASIVLVTVDTLRRDHLGCYGYFRDTSPALDALAEESVVFERAIAAMATTLPSHVSMLTGLYPFQHGVTSNRFAAGGPFQTAKGCRSVAQMLAESGYSTAAFVSGRTVSRATGVDAGFQVFDDKPPPGSLRATHRLGEMTTDRALAWLREHAGERFFLWIHYWDCHEPNVPPEPYASQFAGDEELERLIDQRRIDPGVLARSASKFDLKRLFFPDLLDEHGLQKGDDLPLVDRAAVRDMLNRYDGSVRYVDDQLARLVGALRELGLYDRAILAFTSDHGQSLGQHDWLDHGQLTDDNLLVPLVIHFPPGAIEQPRRVAGAVSLVDLMPTLLARLDGPATRELLEQAEGADALSGEYERAHVFAERSTRDRASKDGARYALLSGRWKLVAREGREPALYDLETDPGELADVRAEHPDVAAGLERELAKVLLRRPAAQPRLEGEESEEFLKTLRELGYTGD